MHPSLLLIIEIEVEILLEVLERGVVFLEMLRGEGVVVVEVRSVGIEGERLSQKTHRLLIPSLVIGNPRPLIELDGFVR